MTSITIEFHTEAKLNEQLPCVILLHGGLGVVYHQCFNDDFVSHKTRLLLIYLSFFLRHSYNYICCLFYYNSFNTCHLNNNNNNGYF